MTVSADEIARVVNPAAWRFHDTALAPYLENRGSANEENWIYQYTWAKGMRTAEDVEAWLRKGDPESTSSTFSRHREFQESLRIAAKILAMIERKGAIPTERIAEQA